MLWGDMIQRHVTPKSFKKYKKIKAKSIVFPFFVQMILEYYVFLQCVFHSIRFKVIKVGATAVALFCCLFASSCTIFPLFFFKNPLFLGRNTTFFQFSAKKFAKYLVEPKISRTFATA